MEWKECLGDWFVVRQYTDSVIITRKELEEFKEKNKGKSPAEILYEYFISERKRFDEGWLKMIEQWEKEEGL